jgi:hypothetical protein
MNERPWTRSLNALATALIGISSIHLLKTFIEIGEPDKAANLSLRPRFGIDA